MKPSTLDVYPDEMLIMAMLLGQLVNQQTEALRNNPTPDQADQIRARIEIATRLRGKLPISIPHDMPEGGT